MVGLSGNARMPAQIRVRPLESQAEMEQCVELQKEIWRFAGESTVPDHLLAHVSEIGGTLLGGFDGGRLRAFLLALPRVSRSGFSHYLHMIGVAEEMAGQGAAMRLFRDYAGRLSAMRDRGFDGRVLWTFDPLQGANARLYLRKLGARGVGFVPDRYGAQRGLSEDLHSDRLEARWLPFEEPARGRLEGRAPDPVDAGPIPRAARVASIHGQPTVVADEPPGKAATLLVEVPHARPKSAALPAAAARAVQLALRPIFGALVANGYAAVDHLVLGATDGGDKNAYVFHRQDGAATP